MSDVTDRKTDVALGVECALPAGFEARGARAGASRAGGRKWWRIAWCVLVVSCLALGFWEFAEDPAGG